MWRTRRRALVPSLHAKFIQSMLGLFGSSTLHGAAMLEKAAVAGQPVEMENFFSRLTLDIIGKAVFDIDFDSLTHDDPIIQVKSLFCLDFALYQYLSPWPRAGGLHGAARGGAPQYGLYTLLGAAAPALACAAAAPLHGRAQGYKHHPRRPHRRLP